MSVFYRAKDFTLHSYKDLLRVALSKYKFVFYHESKPEICKVLLWRHDIDFSPSQALVLARIENHYSVKSTYFVQVTSPYYNILEPGAKENIVKILSYGHCVGLHFDFSLYEINSREDLEFFLNFEKCILESVLSIKVNVFSFHNPTESSAKYQEALYAEMINADAEVIKTNFSYCSDSNGYWRFRRLEDFLNDSTLGNACVLTHPVWWQKEELFPRDKVILSIESNAQALISLYDSTLEKAGRLNLQEEVDE